jgi:hypothetical protein
MEKSKSSLILWFCVLSYFPTSVHAQNDRWVHVVDSENDNQYFLDKTYKTSNMYNVIIWVKLLKADRSSSLELIEYDCSQSSYRTHEIRKYNPEGTLINLDKPLLPAWKHVMSNTVGESLFTSACNLKKKPVPLKPSDESTAKPPGIIRPPQVAQKDLGVDYGIVIVSKANIRDSDSLSGEVIVQASQGDIVVLLNLSPINSWYNILHVESGEEGWIHESTISINYTKQKKADFIIPGERTGSFLPPSVTIKNDTNLVLTLKVGDTRYSFTPQQSHSITFKAGTFKFYASAPGVIPKFGEQTFQQGYDYSWTFYIVRR